MATKPQRVGILALVLALVLVPTPSVAIAPVVLVLVKQIAQQAATSMVKDMLLSSLSGMGCKGIALSNAIAAFDVRAGAGGMGGVLGALGGGLPKLPTGLPGLPGLPGTSPGLPGMGGMPGLPAGLGALPNMPAGAGLVLGGLPSLPGGVPPEMAAKLAAMVPGGGAGMPAGMTLDPEQMAMMARMQQAMSQPLSPPETLATIDELFELGFLPKSMQAELKECMVLVPAAIPALGMGMGMLRPVIPQLRQAREELHALSPAEQDEVAAMLAQELRELPADQRAALMETIESGFFPPAVGAGVKARVGAN
ncbi:hypothetical protein [Rivibacter subsaxonicus]|uniref:Uncharacterized protein n=1 Tax=Rivibacter subsaxonicus TaxID=457575 RepID=A0A4Q7VWR6_9BURK|nr:hypothetical protein [Rivibacter subsaxonicus]RZU01073.1 hypothetical protein EV670_1787 [Rivibacter subsaxonicus]